MSRPNRDCAVCGHPQSLHGVLRPGPCLVGIGDQLPEAKRCGCKAFAHEGIGQELIEGVRDHLSALLRGGR